MATVLGMRLNELNWVEMTVYRFLNFKLSLPSVEISQMMHCLASYSRRGDWYKTSATASTA